MKQENNLLPIFKDGYGRIPKSVMRCRAISIQSKSVYAYLISFAGNKEMAYPSRNLMCYDLNISQDSLSKYIKELVTTGLIYKSQSRKAGNKFASNEYWFRFDVELDKILPEIPSTENSIAENIGTITQENSTIESSVDGISVNGQTVTNNNNENKNNYNNNNDYNNNINNNNIYNNNRESGPSLQELKSIINNYSNYFNSDILELLNQFIEMKQNKKPFKSTQELEYLIKRLSSIKCTGDIRNCLLYSLSNSYTDIYTENYVQKSEEDYKNEKIWSYLFENNE